MQRKYSNTVIFWMLFGHLGGSLRTPIYWFDNESDINLGSFWRWPFQLKGKDEDLCALKCRNEAVKNQNFLACWKIVLQKLFGIRFMKIFIVFIFASLICIHSVIMKWLFKKITCTYTYKSLHPWATAQPLSSQ